MASHLLDTIHDVNQVEDENASKNVFSLMTANFTEEEVIDVVIAVDSSVM